MRRAAKAAVLAACALLCCLASCKDDFSRFQFGEKKAAKARDSGTPNMSDATGNDPDGGAGEADAQSE
jgi:hypothetical protein